MKRKVYAIITSGGTGSRFKGNTPKQYLNLCGKPVILHSMLVFQKCKEINEIIIAAQSKYFDYLHSIASKNKITKLSGLIESGKTRFESVRNAFKSIHGNKNDLVFIHDAARPNINAALLKEMTGYSCEVIPGAKITETVKREKKGFVTETINRENLWTVQTPQMFRFGALESSYIKCKGRKDFTDEASLVEYEGYRVKIIEALKGNIKITTKEDLEYLKKLM